MNEQIRLLAERAGGLEVKTVLNTPPAISLNGHEIEKFAQLIVQECCTKMALEIMDHYVDDALKNTYAHFGVEE